MQTETQKTQNSSDDSRRNETDQLRSEFWNLEKQLQFEDTTSNCFIFLASEDVFARKTFNLANSSEFHFKWV